MILLKFFLLSVTAFFSEFVFLGFFAVFFSAFFAI